MNYHYYDVHQVLLKHTIYSTSEKVPASMIKDLTKGELSDEGNSKNFQVTCSNYSGGRIYSIYEKSTFQEVRMLMDEKEDMILRKFITKE